MVNNERFLSRNPMFTIITIIVFLLCLTPSGCSSANETESMKLVTFATKETGIFLIFVILIFLVSVGKLCYRQLGYISSFFPESFLLILLGVLVGIIIKYSVGDITYIRFTPELFFLILLPPIVLDSAFNIYNRTFGEILGIVIIFAILGTTFSFLFIGFSLYGLEWSGSMGSLRPTGCNFMAILLFSSLIVDVDPVAVLAIFKDLGVEKELYYMIFGESLLNDAITIVLYEIIKDFLVLGPEDIHATNIFLAIVLFFIVSFGGLLIGIVIGFLSSFLTRFQSNSNFHCLTLLMSAYFSYILTYSIKWSGVISIIGCGIVQASYGFQNITRRTQTTLRNVVELLSGTSEAIIFIYLGLEIVLIRHAWNVGFQIFAVLMCVLSRFVVTFMLRVCINYVKVDQRKISWTELFVITYGGLRGAVAFCLVILIHPQALERGGVSDGQNVLDLFVTTTLLIIILTVSVMGTTMKPLARFLRVKSEKHKVLSVYNELNSVVIDNLMSAMEVITNQRGRNRFRLYINHFDNQYIRPWFVNNPFDNTTFKILKRYEQISLALHHANINNQIDEKLLHDIPRSLWPKSKSKPKSKQHESLVNLEIEMIASMKRVSEMVKYADSSSLKTKSLLESTFTNRLNDIARRTSSNCDAFQAIQLASENTDAKTLGHVFTIEIDGGIEDRSKRTLQSPFMKDNGGFDSDSDLESAEKYIDSKF